MSPLSGEAGRRRDRPGAGSRGDVAVETALIIPVLLILLYGAFDVGRYLLVRAAVHRATASFAEVVVDERPVVPDPDNRVAALLGAVYNAIDLSQEHWLRLVDMMVDNDGDVGGIGIEAVWYSVDRGRGRFYLPWEVGEECPGDVDVVSAFTEELFPAPGVVTARNFARPIYLVVRVCYRYRAPHPSLSTFVLPEWVESRFVALRRDLNR